LAIRIDNFMDLKEKKCIPCENKNMPPLTIEEIAPLLIQVKEWTLSEDKKKISKNWVFKDFLKAMNFVDQVADVAEAEGHHPDIHISYNKVTLELSTHSIGGLSENDFIVAVKIDSLWLI
jgi:4a-hydroxytetrahydrobiopterin dehydratase